MSSTSSTTTSSSSYKSTTVSINVRHGDQHPDNLYANDDDTQIQIPTNNQFTTLIETEKLRSSNPEKKLDNLLTSPTHEDDPATTPSSSTTSTIILLTSNNDNNHSEMMVEADDINAASPERYIEEDDDEYDDDYRCDQEINRIVTTDQQDGNPKPVASSSPEPSGNLELVGLSSSTNNNLTEAPLEFQEFDLEYRATNTNTNKIVDSMRFNVSSSSKTVKSSIKSIQKTSSIQSSSFEKVSYEGEQISSSSSISSAAANAEIQQQQQNSITMEEGQSSTEVSNKDTTANGKKKTGEKIKKAGGNNKKSKSNAEISKENISVLPETNLNNLHNPISLSLSSASTQQSPSDLEFVKNKLGPGESRVFAKVCVANLRRSFGDLTVISSAPANNSNSINDQQQNSSSYSAKYSSSNSLEYNRINREFKTRQVLSHTNSSSGPSSLPSFFLNNRNSYSSTNINKLQLFQPAYWDRLLCTNNDSLVENKKSSFSKFDNLTKNSNRSNNSSSAAIKNNEQDDQDVNSAGDASNKKQAPEPKKMYCASCEKQVFQMELIRAEKLDWHKNCFRCGTCRKVLSVDTYQSHEKKLYCKPHFKELFQPKAVIDDEVDGEFSNKEQELSADSKRKSKLQLIICESQPKELPPDVVRASDAASTGLEDIQIDVRSKFEMFENFKENKEGNKETEPILPVKRSASVLAKLKKYENSVGNGSGSEMNGVCDEDLNGVDGIELQSDEDLEETTGENSVIKDEIKRKLKNPLQAMNEIAHFKHMESVRSKWEEGTFTKDQISSEQRKEELAKFRSRLCQGKSGHLKDLYEKGLETEIGGSQARSEIQELKVDKARAFREMFEKGEVPKRGSEDGDGDEDGEGSDNPDGCRGNVDLEVFEAGVARESKRLFEEMDKKLASEQAAEKKQPVVRGSSRFVDKQKAMISANITQEQLEIVRSSDKKEEDIRANTEELSNKFKFFETYENELAKKANENKREGVKRIVRDDWVVKSDKDDEEEDSESLAYRDPTIIRHDEANPDQEQDPLQHSKTTSKMLSVFRQMEESLGKEGNTPIIRPLKQFTPPRDTVNPHQNGGRSSEEEDDDEEEVDDEEEEEEDEQEAEKRMSEDEFLKEVGSLARARSLRAKFERWEQQENERNKGVAIQDELAESIESAKNLKAKFEAMRLMGDNGSVANGQSNKENRNNNVPIRVNRFVLNNDIQETSSTNSSSSRSSVTSNSPHQQLFYNNFSSLPPNLSTATNNGTTQNNQIIMSSTEQCALCEKRVYVMEKIEAGGKMYHKNCFRCSQCKCILRMDTFTSNKGTLFCTTHFKQLFKIKGNYDEGFGHETQYQVWAKKQAAAQQN